MAPPGRRTWSVRLLSSLGAGLAIAILLAIALTVVDLYQAGHGQLLLSRPWLNLKGLGVHLSRADAVCLLGAVIGAALTWCGTSAEPARRS
jgi:hypothetical protein